MERFFGRMKYMSREEALKILKENLSNQNLIKHCFAVEAIMRALARYFRDYNPPTTSSHSLHERTPDEGKWGLVGLLHDIDYEKVKDDLSQHSLLGAKMLKDLGVKYVILGHSERRQILKETDETISDKVKEALKFGLQPILCLGETKEEREKGETYKILEKEIKEDLKKIPKTKIGKIVIAYEPIWAIGSGDPCSVPDAVATILFLKKIISQTFNKRAGKTIRILYGGSVNSQNAGDFLKERWIDGLLVSGASLVKKEFLKILKIAQKI